MMRKVFFGLAVPAIVAIGLGVGTVLLFQSSLSLKSAVSAVLSENGARLERDLVYGPAPRQKLDVYRPKSGAERTPVLLYLYGGGWRQGDKVMYGFVGTSYAARGYTTVIPNYRLYPDVGFPRFVEDAARAYAWVAQNVARTETGQRPIVVMGHSAGAHIGALLTLDKRYLAAQNPALGQPAGFIGIAGPYAFDPTTWHSTRSIFAGAPRADDARPVAFARADAPPMLVMHGLEDGIVKLWNMQTLTKALRARGARVEDIELENVGHIEPVLTIAWPLRWRAPVFEETLRFVGSLAAG